VRRPRWRQPSNVVAGARPRPAGPDVVVFDAAVRWRDYAADRRSRVGPGFEPDAYLNTIDG
jgi:hypothetical protein